MTFTEFLTNNGITVETQQLTTPQRYCVKLVKPPLSVTTTADRLRTEVFGIGASEDEAMLDLFNNCVGKTIRLKGWDENDNYVDTKIKVPKDLEN